MVVLLVLCPLLFFVGSALWSCTGYRDSRGISILADVSGMGGRLPTHPPFNGSTYDPPTYATPRLSSSYYYLRPTHTYPHLPTHTYPPTL